MSTTEEPAVVTPEREEVAMPHSGAARTLTESELEDRAVEFRDAASFLERIREALGLRIVGQESLIDRLLISLLTGGHILLEGVPGLAKTLTVSTLADAIDVLFHRIQFTPDLLPADLIGTLVWNERSGNFEPKRGPIFANIILADEVNRAPAKVQSALLEAMQERQVTIGDVSHPLPSPFLVLATQNPIEHEGTYPLPEAQVDRFMFKVRVTYPDRKEEREVMRRMVSEELEPIVPVARSEEILAARKLLPTVYLDDRVEDYILDLVRTTRNPAASGLPDLEEWLEYGASPRATIYLGRAARAWAFINGRAFVLPEDVQELAREVLRHRIVLTFQAEAEQVDVERILDRLLEAVPVP